MAVAQLQHVFKFGKDKRRHCKLISQNMQHCVVNSFTPNLPCPYSDRADYIVVTYSLIVFI